MKVIKITMFPVYLSSLLNAQAVSFRLCYDKNSVLMNHTIAE